MIKQNMKIALFTILGLIGLWLIIFCFIKIDVCSQAWIIQEEGIFKVRIDAKDAVYIESHDRQEHIRLQYKKQYDWCELTNPEPEAEYTYYTIFNGPSFDPNLEIESTNLIIDSLNIYQYITKK